MRKFRFDKLVRDKVSQLCSSRDVYLDQSSLNDEEYKFYLKKKLLEEAEEIFSSSSKENLIEEIADLEEVLGQIIKVFELKLEDITAKRQEKLESLGGFSNKAKANFIEINENDEFLKPWLENYLNNKNKYPEIID